MLGIKKEFDGDILMLDQIKESVLSRAC